jgi:hypothetical protein
MFPKDDIFWRLVNEARKLRKAQLRHRLGNWTTITVYLTGYKWALLDERSLQRRSA